MKSLRYIAAAATVTLSLPVFAVPTTSTYDFGPGPTSSSVTVRDGTAINIAGTGNAASQNINSYDGFQNGQYFGNNVTYAGSAGGTVTVTAWASTGTGGSTPTGAGSGVNTTATNNGTIQNAVVTQYSVANGGTGPYASQGNALGETSRNTKVNAEFGNNSNGSTTCVSGTSCQTLSSQPNHAVDNNGAYETLLLSFQAATRLTGLTIGFPGGSTPDSDM